MKVIKKKKASSIDRDTWALDYTIAKFALPRLKRFKEISITYPGTEEVPTPEAWNEILDKMIFSMEYIIQDNSNNSIGVELHQQSLNGEISKEKWLEREKKYGEQVQEGLDLFGKYFRALWW